MKERVLMIPGVRKCGTTTLFKTLERHSQVRAPRVKEPQFFALQPETINANMEWYEALFPDEPGGVLMDGSTLCFTSPHSAECIAGVFDDPRVVVMLRDPARRAYSAYLHMTRQIHRGEEKRSFADILAQLESRPDGETVVEHERIMLAGQAESGAVNSDFYSRHFHRDYMGAPFETDFHDPMIGYRYFEESCYSRFIGKYERTFAKNLKIVFFEEMLDNPERVLKDVLEFAGLSQESDALKLLHENKARVPKNRVAASMAKLRHKNRFMRKTVEVLKGSPFGDVGRKLQARLWKNPENMSNEMKERAVALLADEYAYWYERYPYLRKYWKV